MKYRVVEDPNNRDACSHCGHGKLWTVEDTAESIVLGESFGDKEHAEDLAGYMNDAYANGQKSTVESFAKRFPGIKAKHAIITPNCRVVQGSPTEAFDEATARLKVEYTSLQGPVNEQADFHLILTCDRRTRTQY